MFLYDLVEGSIQYGCPIITPLSKALRDICKKDIEEIANIEQCHIRLPKKDLTSIIVHFDNKMEKYPDWLHRLEATI